MKSDSTTDVWHDSMNPLSWVLLNPWWDNSSVLYAVKMESLIIVLKRLGFLMGTHSQRLLISRTRTLSVEVELHWSICNYVLQVWACAICVRAGGQKGRTKVKSKGKRVLQLAPSVCLTSLPNSLPHHHIPFPPSLTYHQPLTICLAGPPVQTTFVDRATERAV